MGSFTFLIGGVRSGKSSLAVEIGRRHVGSVVVIATAEPFDDDLRDRIERHRDDRPAWPVIEEPVDLVGALSRVPAADLVIIDCLTVWVGNLLHHGVPLDIAALTTALTTALRARSGPCVVVSNEVGLGVHPETELGRRYRDLLGAVNRDVAASADTTLFLAAGRALRLDDPWTFL